MSEDCAFCGKPVNPYDVGTYSGTMNWEEKVVNGGTAECYGGQKLYAHKFCIRAQFRNNGHMVLWPTRK